MADPLTTSPSYRALNVTDGVTTTREAIFGAGSASRVGIAVLRERNHRTIANTFTSTDSPA
jgi:hypothetical protein